MSLLSACHNVVLPVFWSRNTAAIEEKDKNVQTADVLKALEMSLEDMLIDKKVYDTPSSQAIYLKSFKNLSKLFISEEDVRTSFERMINPDTKFYIAPPTGSAFVREMPQKYFVTIELTEATLKDSEELIYQVSVRLYDPSEHLVGIWRDNIRQLVEDGSWW